MLSSIDNGLKGIVRFLTYQKKKKFHGRNYFRKNAIVCELPSRNIKSHFQCDNMT